MSDIWTQKCENVDRFTKGNMKSFFFVRLVDITGDFRYSFNEIEPFKRIENYLGFLISIIYKNCRKKYPARLKPQRI